MNTLKAEKRSMNVKAKKLRRDGYVTGNLFGREIDGSVPLQMKRMDVENLLKTDNKGSQVMLEVEGKTYDALIKEVDYNSMNNRYDEVDFQALVSNEKVHSVAEIILVNTDSLAEGAVQENLSEVAYKAFPSALVDKIKIDVSHMKVGDTVRVGDLEIAKNPEISMITDLNAVVATVAAVHNVVPETESTEDGAAE